MLLAVLATLLNGLVVAYGVQRDALIRSALEANRAYAFKVASSIEVFLHSVHERLGYSSHLIGRDFTNRSLLEAEAKRLQSQDSELNIVLIVDASGTLLMAYPNLLLKDRSVITSEGLSQALAERRPLVSHAYRGANGKLIVFVSHPIFSPAGEFLGVVGGSVYLEQSGVMRTLIGEHQLNGTFAFVTDDNRRLLYHPQRNRIGETLPFSETVDAALHDQLGAMQAVNDRGVPMLAGYASVASANWAVIAQQSREEALTPLSRIMWEMLKRIVPFGLIGVALILISTAFVSRPLRQLATQAAHLSEPEAATRLHAINAWYAEAAAIRRALIAGVELLQQRIGSLSRAADSDALTGLANRRAMNTALSVLDSSGQQYAALALDIDHFKRVNDTFGHDAGDEALRQIARVISECSRSGDLACRAGGEEFCLLLPDTELDTASAIAERIRETIATTRIENVGALTISIGVACRGDDTPASDSILKRADQRLYQAKQTGRNRVVAIGPPLQH